MGMNGYPSKAKGTNEEGRGEAGQTKFSVTGKRALSAASLRRPKGERDYSGFGRIGVN